MYELGDDGMLTQSGQPLCTLAQAFRLLEYGLSRRERGSGILTFLRRQLRRFGHCTYEKRWFHLYIRFDSFAAAYRISCKGLLADLFVERAVLRAEGVEAVTRWKKLHEELRKKRRLERKLARARSPQQVLRPDRSKLVRHFRRSALKWSTAVSIVAYAVRSSVSSIERRLRVSWDRNPADKTATLRLSGGFVIRIDAALPDSDSFVALYSTKSSEHGVYRRLRNRCREVLRKQGKKNVMQRARLDRRRWLLRRSRAAA